jgi:hypothetical protein
MFGCGNAVWIRVMLALGVFAVYVPDNAQAAPPELKISVKIFDREDYRGRLELAATGSQGHSFELKGTNGWLAAPITLPTGVKELAFKGNLEWEHYERGKQKSSGESIQKVVDISKLIRPLREVASPWDKRMKNFLAAVDTFEEEQSQLEESFSEYLLLDEPQSQIELKKAEERFKFALPREHKEMLHGFGTWSILDSFFVSADMMDRADRQMRSIWESPASEFASLPKEAQEIYQSSVMLYVEVGDGYGALFYRPDPADSTRGLYYWATQGELSAPRLLVDTNGKARDYNSVMLWLIANQFLSQLENAFPNQTIIDPTSPGTRQYILDSQLHTQKKLECRLLIEWDSFE